MTIDTVAARAYPTLPRIDKFIATARKFLACRDPPTQCWQVLLGDMSSLEKLVPRERLRMRSLQWHLKSHWSPERDPSNLPVPWSRQIEEDLSWWMVRDHLLEGTPFGTPAYTRMSPERAGELTSSTSRCREYGHTRRARYTSISWS